MQAEELERYLRAKEVSDRVIEFAKGLVKEGVQVLDLAECVEKKILELGAKPAFPVNISINQCAAHYTPDIKDELRVQHGDLVKVDIGVHVGGYVWDRAFTVCVGERSHPLIEAAQKALDQALKTIKVGTKIFEVSEAVESTLESLGFKPIRNLCGHGLERYNQHAWPSIPNGRNNIRDEIKEGMVIAMEVFATDGFGWVKESKPVLIYRYAADKPTRLVEARKILELAKREYLGLPFAKRWLAHLTSPFRLDLALKQLVEVGALEEYPVLKEVGNGLVAQAEETVVVGK